MVSSRGHSSGGIGGVDFQRRWEIISITGDDNRIAIESFEVCFHKNCIMYKGKFPSVYVLCAVLAL